MTDQKSINVAPETSDPFENALAMIEAFIASLESRLEKAQSATEPRTERIPSDVPYFETW